MANVCLFFLFSFIIFHFALFLLFNFAFPPFFPLFFHLSVISHLCLLFFASQKFNEINKRQKLIEKAKQIRKKKNIEKESEIVVIAFSTTLFVSFRFPSLRLFFIILCYNFAIKIVKKEERGKRKTIIDVTKSKWRTDGRTTMESKTTLCYETNYHHKEEDETFKRN